MSAVDGLLRTAVSTAASWFAFDVMAEGPTTTTRIDPTGQGEGGGGPGASFKGRILQRS